uniref:BRO-A n=1 Tax=Helicoverpa armigera SNPV TaxID=991878 RepID=F1CG78_9ABAC|nr:BRO-A [Helicoverpa armigera SNPV]ADY88155.1 BRO-A [Helicoverpa armigera SNPV]
MSLTKIKFGDKEVETYTVDFDGEKWMVANPFAEALDYSRANKAIFEKVSAENQRTYDQIRSHRMNQCDRLRDVTTPAQHPSENEVHQPCGRVRVDQRERHAGCEAFPGVEQQRPATIAVSRGRVQNGEGRARRHRAWDDAINHF